MIEQIVKNSTGVNILFSSLAHSAVSSLLDTIKHVAYDLSDVMSSILAAYVRVTRANQPYRISFHLDSLTRMATLH